MGLHMLPEKVSNLHKWMISQGNVLGKPVVLASQIVLVCLATRVVRLYAGWSRAEARGMQRHYLLDPGRS